MGQKPIAVRVRTTQTDEDGAQSAAVSVGEAARCLGVSERTVFRLLKTGALERVQAPAQVVTFQSHDRHMTDIKTAKHGNTSHNEVMQGTDAALHDSHTADNDMSRTHRLTRQVQEKDAQITQLIATQQEMAQTIQRLQEQVYELAHMVLTHNVAAAQARAAAEIKAHEAAQRRGLSGLLGTRKRS